MKRIWILACAIFALSLAAQGAPRGGVKVFGKGEGNRDGQFQNPYGLAFAPDGSLWISDTGNSRVQKISPSGDLEVVMAKTIRKSDVEETSILKVPLSKPVDLAFAPDGTLYVADAAGHKVLRFNKRGKAAGGFGEKGSAPGQFDSPAGIAVDAQGNVYVTDEKNNRVQKFEPSGRLVRNWGQLGRADGQFDSPWGIAVDAQGNVWVADWGNNRLQKFDSEGGHLLSVTGGTGADALRRPSDVWIAGGREVWVSAWNGQGAVYVFDLQGHLVRKTGENLPNNSKMFSIAVGPDGNVYLASGLQSRIVSVPAARLFASAEPIEPAKPKKNARQTRAGAKGKNAKGASAKGKNARGDQPSKTTANKNARNTPGKPAASGAKGQKGAPSRNKGKS